MLRKSILLWAIVVLPLAAVMFGCGEDTTTPTGNNNTQEQEFTTDWKITIQTSGIETPLQEVFFDADSGAGWAVGNEGVILHTTDKGETWEKQDSGETGTLYSVFFVDANEGWVAGDGGRILHTEDGGASWDLQNSGVTGALRGLFFANDSQGWAAGEAGVIIGTKDGGAAWNPQNTGSNQNLEAIDFAPPKAGEIVIDKGWAVGVNGTILHTSNAGGRWLPQPVKNVTELL